MRSSLAVLLALTAMTAATACPQPAKLPRRKRTAAVEPPPPATATPGMLLELALDGAVATVTATRPCDDDVGPPPRLDARPSMSPHQLAVGEAVVRAAAGERPVTEHPATPQREAGTRALVCAVPVGDLRVSLALPSGSIVHASTDARGVATFVVSDDEPDGPLVAQAGAIRTPVVMRARSQPGM